MTLSDDLLSHLQQFSTAPFLFVGSGASRRYLGLEDWEELLRRFVEPLDQPYEFFRSSGDGYPPAIASEIAEALHDQWWSDERYEESRNEYREQARTRESALKIEVARYLLDRSNNLPTEDDPLADEVKLLRQSTIDGVITTNWDLFLEEIFPELEVFVGQDELLFKAGHLRFHGPAVHYLWSYGTGLHE